MNKHAILSPSGADRWMQCAASVVVTAGREDEGNEYADEGTAAHHAAAEFLSGRSVDVGLQVQVGEERFYPIDQDMIDHAKNYATNVRRIAGEGAQLLAVEVAVPIDHLTREEGATGTSDAVAITRDGAELQVHDYKYGMRGVSPERNRQLMHYASGALRLYAALEAADVERVRLVIHQPRVSEAPKEWDCSVDELRVFETEVKAAVAKVELARGVVDNEELLDGFFNPGEKQCQWCIAKPDCPHLARFVQDRVGAEFPVLAEGKHADAAAAILEGPAELPAEELATAAEATRLIEMWIKAVRGEVERRLLAGQPVPRWKLVKGREGNRAWINETEVEALLKKMRLKHEVIYKSTLNTPPALEKLLGKVSPKKWRSLEPYIKRAEGGISVAPESDARPAHDPNANVKEQFPEVPQNNEDLM